MLKSLVQVSFLMALILRYGLAQNCANSLTPILISSFNENYDTVCPSFTVAVTLRITIVRTTIGCFSNGQFLTDTTNSVNPSFPYFCSITSLPECTGSCIENQGTAKVNCFNALGAQFRYEFPYTTRNCDVLEWSRWNEIRTCASGNAATSLRTRTCQHLCTGTTIDSAYCPVVASESETCVTTTTATESTRQIIETTVNDKDVSTKGMQLSTTTKVLIEPDPSSYCYCCNKGVIFVNYKNKSKSFYQMQKITKPTTNSNTKAEFGEDIFNSIMKQ